MGLHGKSSPSSNRRFYIQKKKVSSIISEFLHTAKIGEYFIYLEQVGGGGGGGGGCGC